MYCKFFYICGRFFSTFIGDKVLIRMIVEFYLNNSMKSKVNLNSATLLQI